MDILWDCPEQMCTRDVLEKLTSHRLAYTTVATVLTHLVSKGMVERVSTGRTWAHRPVQTRSQYAAGLMAQALTTSGNPAASFLHFVEAMSPEDAALLRGLLTDPDRETGDPPSHGRQAR
jgi:predicted transcriptional regulator